MIHWLTQFLLPSDSTKSSTNLYLYFHPPPLLSILVPLFHKSTQFITTISIIFKSLAPLAQFFYFDKSVFFPFHCSNVSTKHCNVISHFRLYFEFHLIKTTKTYSNFFQLFILSFSVIYISHLSTLYHLCTSLSDHLLPHLFFRITFFRLESLLVLTSVTSLSYFFFHIISSPTHISFSISRSLSHLLFHNHHSTPFFRFHISTFHCITVPNCHLHSPIHINLLQLSSLFFICLVTIENYCVIPLNP